MLKTKKKGKKDKASRAPGTGLRAGNSNNRLCVESVSMHLARKLEDLTGLESRVTSLGHLQRGGTPSPADRLLATRLGTACAELIEDGQFGVMVAVKGERCVPVPLEKVAGSRKIVPPDHPWIESARLVGTSFGD